MQLELKVKKAIGNLLPHASGQGLLVAVSGGADSIALLHLLQRLAPALRIRLVAAHLNHGLRAPASDEDAAFVRETARQLGLACVVARSNVRRRARQDGCSLEMAGRAARYDFFRRAARRHGCAAVATAHTADDHAETILLKLARGSGPQGLGGISAQGQHGRLLVVRPLRDIRRRELVAFLRQNDLAWREDASNQDRTIPRNLVRHDILPLLETQLNPRLREALWRLAEIAEAENTWLEDMVQPMYRQCLINLNPPALNCDLMQAYPLAARRRILRMWLTAALPTVDLDFGLARRLEGLLPPDRSGKQVCLPGGNVIRREYGLLKLATRTRPVSFSVQLTVPGETVIPECGWRIKCSLQPAGRPGGGPGLAMLSAAQWRRRKLIARNWQPGDRMRPYGLQGGRKLQDIFSDLKVPVTERRRMPLLVCGDEIIWLPEYRIAQAWALRPNERRMLLIEAHPS